MRQWRRRGKAALQRGACLRKSHCHDRGGGIVRGGSVVARRRTPAACCCILRHSSHMARLSACTTLSRALGSLEAHTLAVAEACGAVAAELHRVGGEAAAMLAVTAHRWGLRGRVGIPPACRMLGEQYAPFPVTRGRSRARHSKIPALTCIAIDQSLAIHSHSLNHDGTVCCNIAPRLAGCAS